MSRDSASSLPFLSTPHDTLRQGLPALKADSQLVHPIAAVQAGVRLSALTPHSSLTSDVPQGPRTHSTAEMQANLYGSAFPARRELQRQILSRVRRLPGSGLPSARLGLEVMTGALHLSPQRPCPALTSLHLPRVSSGELDDFSFESYLGFPGEKEAAPAGSIHTRNEPRANGAPAVLRPGF